jgi:hypothetical protein
MIIASVPTGAVKPEQGVYMKSRPSPKRPGITPSGK